jgi:hypothetical protein
VITIAQARRQRTACAGPPAALKNVMRSTFVILLLSLGVGGLWLAKSHRTASEPEKHQQVSRHDWAKQALDRTAEVKRQVAQQRKENEAP